MTGAAKRTERKAGSIVGISPPLTATRRALLVAGSDRLLREVIADMLTMSRQVQALRGYLARRLGVSEPEYRVFLAIAQLQGASGVNVSTVARHLAVSGAFVTMTARRLARRGHVVKSASAVDRRGVLLRLSGRGLRLMRAFAAEPQVVNDALFGGISRSEFVLLSSLARRLVAGGERALAIARARALDGETHI